MTRSTRTYDHRLRDFVRQTRDVAIATRAGVPRSTAAGWLKGSGRSSVTRDGLSLEQNDLQIEVLRLQRRIEKLRAVARILVATLRALDIDLGHHRIPDGVSKSLLVGAIERGRGVLTLRKALALIGLSSSRFHAWKRAAGGCELDDHSSCPKSSPQRVALSEVPTIREMVTSPEYRHVRQGRSPCWRSAWGVSSLRPRPGDGSSENAVGGVLECV